MPSLPDPDLDSLKPSSEAVLAVGAIAAVVLLYLCWSELRRVTHAADAARFEAEKAVATLETDRKVPEGNSRPDSENENENEKENESVEVPVTEDESAEAENETDDEDGDGDGVPSPSAV